MTPEQRFQAVVQSFEEITLLQTAADTLEWDERTGLPAEAGDYRASQVTLLRGMIHERRTAVDLASVPSSDVGATISRLNEDFERERKLPKKLVESLARATVLGQQKWDAARRADNYAAFQPALTEILALKCEAAAHQQTEGHPRVAVAIVGKSRGSLTRFLAQLYDAAVEQLGDIEAAIAKGDASELLLWLRKHIHQHGRIHEPHKLIERATGKPLHSDALIHSLTKRYTPLYGL